MVQSKAYLSKVILIKPEMHDNSFFLNRKLNADYIQRKTGYYSSAEHWFLNNYSTRDSARHADCITDLLNKWRTEGHKLICQDALFHSIFVVIQF